MHNYSLKEKVGCLLFDVPRLVPALFAKGRWIYAWNRHESLKVENGGVDTTALGRWSNDIYACRVFPWIGRRLMQNAFSEWPIRFADRIKVNENPEVSFVIPHRGKDRLLLLKAVISSIFAQEGVAVECIIVEQNNVREINGLPDYVKYIHLPHPEDPIGWHKSWAFNKGICMANADIVVCHDSDILIPNRYAQEIVRHMRYKEIEVAILHRFLFCLNRGATEQCLSKREVNLNVPPERIRQNWQGGTLAIKKDAFFKIGGYDERFVGWGGEDNEFFDRCSVLECYTYGYIPFVHLWHAPQNAKISQERERNIKFLKELLVKLPDRRIAELKKEKVSEK